MHADTFCPKPSLVKITWIERYEIAHHQLGGTEADIKVNMITYINVSLSTISDWPELPSSRSIGTVASRVTLYGYFAALVSC